MIRKTLLLLALLGSATIAASAPVHREQIPVDVQLNQARADAATAAAEQQRLEKAASEARDEVARLRARQLAAAQAIEATEAQITVANLAVQLADTRLAAQREQLAARQAPASALLGGLVLMARRPPVLLLADSGSPEEMVKLRMLVAATAPVIRSRTEALSRQLDAGRALERSAVEARTALQHNRELLAKRRTDLVALEQQAVELAGRRGSEALGAGDVAIARQEQLGVAEEGALSNRQAGRIAAELAGLGPVPFRSSGAASSAPLDYRLPAAAPVTEGLGSISANGVRSRGITLATRRGTPLVAPASGTILFAGPFRDYDGILIIDHGGRWKSVIVNAGSKLQRGSKVSIGEPIGIALGAVEIELQRNGTAVSPALIAGSSAMLSKPAKGG